MQIAHQAAPRPDFRREQVRAGLNDKETVDILIKFTGYRGACVIHCHQLEHERVGIMMNFEVV